MLSERNFAIQINVVGRLMNTPIRFWNIKLSLWRRFVVWLYKKLGKIKTYTFWFDEPVTVHQGDKLKCEVEDNNLSFKVQRGDGSEQSVIISGVDTNGKDFGLVGKIIEPK